MAITLDGNSNVSLAFSSGGRITGDYSNATLLSRAMFQTSTTNGSTGIYALPNGTSTAASWQATNAADPTNASKILIATNGSTDCQLVSGRNGTGTYLPLTFYTNGSEQMRLDTSGNLGIGTSSPSSYAQLAVIGAGNTRVHGECTTANGIAQIIVRGTASKQSYFWQAGASFPTYNSLVAGNAGIYANTNLSYEVDAAGYQSWWTNASERMRIDSSGNLLVGTTSSSITANVGIKFIGNPAEPYMGIVTPFNNANNTNYHLYSTATGSMRFYVGSNGQISAVSTTISAISDQRLKENVRDLDDGLSTILALKPRKFDWKEGKGKDIKDDRGFIAQEFEQVFPDLIDIWKDPAPEGEEPYKAVRPDLIPVMVKAIQELTARLEALENK